MSEDEDRRVETLRVRDFDEEHGEPRTGERAVIVLVGLMAAVALVLSAVNLLGAEPLLGGDSPTMRVTDGGVSEAELETLERRVADLKARLDASPGAAVGSESGATADLAAAFATLRADVERRVSRLESSLGAAPAPAATPTTFDEARDLGFTGDAATLLARVEALEWRVDTFNNLVAPDFAGEIGRQGDCISALQSQGRCSDGH